MQTIYWLVLFVILLLIEIVTLGLTTIWFAGGALAAFVCGWIGFGLTVQVIVFLVVSVVLLVLTRPIVVKHFNQDRQKTNVESLIGAGFIRVHAEVSLGLPIRDRIHRPPIRRGHRLHVIRVAIRPQKNFLDGNSHAFEHLATQILGYTAIAITHNLILGRDRGKF